MDVFLLRSGNPHQRSTFVRYEFCEILCGTPLGFVVFVHFNPVCAVRHWALEWNCVAVLSSLASFNPGYVDLSSYLFFNDVPFSHLIRVSKDNAQLPRRFPLSGRVYCDPG